jgi:hypothetical protein
MAQDDRDLAGGVRVGPLDREAHRRPGTTAIHELGERGKRVEPAPVDGQQDVADAQPRLLGRATGENHAQSERAGPVVEIEVDAEARRGLPPHGVHPDDAVGRRRRREEHREGRDEAAVPKGDGQSASRIRVIHRPPTLTLPT